MSVSRKKIGWFTALLLLVAPGLIVMDQSLARGLPPKEGIRNFGKINELLYRGAQPDELGITNLARLGIKSIINLRMTDDLWQPEAAQASAHGILYTNLPMRGVGRPTDAQINMVLATISSLPGPVFIHCQHGCDRTGTIIACYRVQHDHWSNADALKEAAHYGMSWFERGMKSYVLGFAKLPEALATK